MPRLHDHTFGQDQRRPGETRTWLVIGLTTIMMVVEIGAGWLYGSMALLADGLHMASHAAALGIAAFAYAYARRKAKDPRFSFGVGKVNALAGFTGAILLALFALLMAKESVERLLEPVAIEFDQAIGVAVVGLIVNGVSMLLLGHHHDHGEGDAAGEPVHANEHDHPHHHDHNLRSAYLHVLADALTSLLAIIALFAGKLFGWVWLDPMMGVVGAILVARWSIGLIRTTSAVLLDHQLDTKTRAAIRESIESEPGDEIVDLHLWSIGPGLKALILAIRSESPSSPDEYRQRLPHIHGLEHVTIEVHGRQSSD
ncbi:MAG: CDF family Co(II)/Ni(II) efflux transporter DmeF [Planctomycetota bacterium]